MNRERSKRVAVSIAIGGVLLLGVLLCLSSLSGAPPPAYALPAMAQPTPTVHPGPSFVKQGGTGLGCTQSDPCGSIQYAIEYAFPGYGDVIYVAGGVYTGTGEAVITITKNVTLYGGWDGSPYSPVVRDPGQYPTILDGEGQRRVILILKTTSVSPAPTIDGFIIANGNASNVLYYGSRCGGGIYSRYASPIITNNIITNNVAYTGTSGIGSGGGICAEYSNGGAVIAYNQVISNVATWAVNGSGGGISLSWMTGTQVIENVVVSNTAAVSATGSGGGIYVGNCSGAVLQGNHVERNVASANGQGSGGGISLSGSQPVTLTGNVILTNTASITGGLGSGGGIFLSANDRAFLIGNRIEDNVA